MILEVRQTASSLKQAFDIYYNGGKIYQGASGSVSRFENIELSQKGKRFFHGKYQAPNWKTHIPLLPLFHYNKKTRIFQLYSNDENVGVLYHSHHGFMKRCHVIELLNGDKIYAYTYSKGKVEYVSFYLNEKQIAQMEVFIGRVVSNMYTYTIYLLDGFAKYHQVFCLFALHYASYHHAERLEINQGKTTSTSAYTISPYNDKFDPNWKALHFQQEELTK